MHPIRRLSTRALRRVVAAFVLVAFAAAVHADATREPPVPLLWKVSDDDNAVYLLGSFHLLKPNDYPLSRDIDTALADADVVMFEIPPEELGSPALGMRMAQAAMRSDGTLLDSDLPEETRAALARWMEGNATHLQALQLTPQAMQMFEPWFAGLMVAVVEMGKAGLDPALGLDMHLARRATQAGKSMGGLETGTEQIAFLDGMALEEQVQFLQEALAGAELGSEEIEKLHAAWRNGDVDTLWASMAVEMRERFPGLYRRINVARNDAWVERLDARLRSPGTEDTLVVVGALHLLGEDGVVEKLRARGYEVERICSACATR